MDLFVSILLIYLGLRMFRKQQSYLSDSLDYEESFWLTIGRSFLLTIVNPLTIFFFMFISVKIMPENITRLASLDFIISSLMLSAGSLATFSLVSFAGKMLGHTLDRKQLFIASYITGLIFIVIGLYFSFDFIKLVVQSFM
jgi:threonine/homoserine/homoserine lactone efflux protein